MKGALNLGLFLILAVLPECGEKPAGHSKALAGMLNRLIPDHPIGSAAMAVLVTGLGGLAATRLSVDVFSAYGISLFVALPFCVGLVAVLLYGFHRPRRYGQCLFVSIVATALLGVILLAAALEGVICLLMAAPLALVLAALGGTIGYAIQRRPMAQGDVPPVLLVLILFLPLLMGAEYLTGRLVFRPDRVD